MASIDSRVVRLLYSTVTSTAVIETETETMKITSVGENPKMSRETGTINSRGYSQALFHNIELCFWRWFLSILHSSLCVVMSAVLQYGSRYMVLSPLSLHGLPLRLEPQAHIIVMSRAPPFPYFRSRAEKCRLWFRQVPFDV